MALVMVVDKMKYKWFGIITILSLLFLVATTIVAIVGPNERIVTIDYAYKCENNSHTWNPDSCGGVQLSNNDTNYWHELPPLGKLNSLWKLSMFPYNKLFPTEVEEELVVSVSIFVKQETNSEWIALSSATQVNSYLICNTKDEECLGVSLILQAQIPYEYWAVRVAFPNTPDNFPAKTDIGDVSFRYEWVNENYAIEEIVVRLIYLFISGTIFGGFIFVLSKIPRYDWSLEQRLLLVLHFSLVLFNNPLYIFEFLFPGSFFPMLDCFFIVILQTSLLLVWLMLFDYMRKGEIVVILTKFDFIKPIIISIYSISSFALYTWFRIADLTDPVLGENETSLTYFLLLFILTAILFAGVLVWVVILLSLAVAKVVKEKGVFVNRLIMLGTASSFVIVSMSVSLLFGNFGPINQSAFSFVYFYSLNNLYIWVLTLSYLPYEVLFESQKMANKKTTSDDNAFLDSSEDTPIFPPSVESNYSATL